MSLLKKILFIFAFLLLASPNLGGTPALAEDEFDTSYQIIYTVNPDASVKVQQKVTLTNKLSQVYATEYQMTLGTTQIEDISAWDGLGQIKPEVSSTKNSTRIKLNFNQQVVGKDEKLNFSLDFTSFDFASLNGQVLEIGIPKMQNLDSLSDYQVTLRLPKKFGQPLFILPQPNKVEDSGNTTVYHFDKNRLLNQSIIASFGEKQIFDFELIYELENNTDQPVYQQIVLPPDSTHQKIYLNHLSLVPDQVKVDADQNWLGQYLIIPEEKKTITVQGQAEIFLKSRKDFPLTKPDSNLLTNQQKYWPVNHEQIQELALELKDTQEAYRFVLNQLNYDYKKVETGSERLGGLAVLNHKDEAICMEFTDLFITLNRALGIPSREINGYAYTNNPRLKPLSLNQTILHSWPQYYDAEKNSWVNIDPTWEKTSGLDFFNRFDLNHLAFVFHGQDSQWPAFNADQIKVEFGTETKEKVDYDLHLDYPSQVLAGTKVQAKAIIKNLGNTAIYEPDYPVLAPYATIEKTINLAKTNLLTQEEIEFEVSFKDKTEKAKIKIISPIKAYLLPYGGGAVGGIFIFVVSLFIYEKVFKKLAHQ